MERGKGETFREIILLLSVVILFIGLVIFFFAFFLCIELDYSEEQLNACSAQANIVQFVGFLIISGSIVSILYEISGISRRNSSLKG